MQAATFLRQTLGNGQTDAFGSTGNHGAAAA
jgi:hypothetical protein